MSHFTRLTVPAHVSDRDLLVKALQRVFGEQAVVVSDRPLAIATTFACSWAHVVAPRRTPAADGRRLFGDFGVRFEPSGETVVIMDQTEDGWALDRVRQAYAIEQARAHAATLGWAVVGETTDPDGSVRVIMAPRVGATVTLAAEPGGQATVSVAGVPGLDCLRVTESLVTALGGAVQERTMTCEAWQAAAASATLAAEEEA
jgi:hypothetical protein